MEYDKISIISGFGYWQGMDFKRAPSNSNRCIVEDTTAIQSIAPDPANAQNTIIRLKNGVTFKAPNQGLLYINNKVFS